MSSTSHRATGKMHCNIHTPSSHMWSSKHSNSSDILIKNSRFQPHLKRENNQHVTLQRDQKRYQDKMQEGSIRSINTCVRNKVLQHRTTGRKRVTRLIMKYANACYNSVTFLAFSRSIVIITNSFRITAIFCLKYAY